MSRTALIISGGGSKGAFAVGVLKFIFSQRPDIRFDMVCGTSTGALIAPLAALRHIEELEGVYTGVETKDILLKGNLVDRLLHHNSLYDTSPLAALVTRTLSQLRYDQLLASGLDIILTTVCLQTQRITYFTLGAGAATLPVSPDYDLIGIASREELLRAIVASADQPVLMPPIEIRSTPEQPRQYVDGGVREQVPLQIAIDNGATDIYVIVMSPETNPATQVKYSRLESTLLRTIDLLLEDVAGSDLALPRLYNQALQYMDSVKHRLMTQTGLPAETVEQLFAVAGNPFAGKKALKLHIIRPAVELAPDGGLEFIPAQMKQMVALGESTAREYFNRVVV